MCSTFYLFYFLLFWELTVLPSSCHFKVMYDGWDGTRDLLAVRLGSPPLDHFLACYIKGLGFDPQQ